MVAKASKLLPEPDTPLTTVSLPCGISQEMFFRLWVRAPRITIASFAEVNENAPENSPSPSQAPGIARASGLASRGIQGALAGGTAQGNSIDSALSSSRGIERNRLIVIINRGRTATWPLESRKARTDIAHTPTAHTDPYATTYGATQG